MRSSASSSFVVALLCAVAACSAPPASTGPTAPIAAPIAAPTSAPVTSNVAPAASSAATPPPALNPPRGTAAPRVEARTFASAALGVTKRYQVFFPRGYDDSQHRFPVLYLLHGLGGNEDNWIKHGGLVAAATLVDVPFIIVMPDGDDSFYVNRPTADSFDVCSKQKPPWDGSEKPETYCVKTPRYEDYVVTDLVAHIDGSLRTRSDRRARAIAGLSMGGFGALSLSLRHPDVFSATASHSGMASLLYAGPHPFAAGKGQLAVDPGAWGGQYPEKFRAHVKKIFGADIAFWRDHDPTTLVPKAAPEALTMFVDCGQRDDFKFHDHASLLHESLEQRGVTHKFALVPGVHDWKLWTARLPESLKFFTAHFVAQR